MSHKDILQKNYVYLLNHLNSSDILHYLYQEKVFDRREYNHVTGIHDAKDRNKALIHKIEQKSEHKFGKFLLALEKYQHFVIDHLDQTTGLSLREEFQLDAHIQTGQADLKNLQKEKQNLKLELQQLEKRHGRQIKTMEFKLKEIQEAQAHETENRKTEFKEKSSRLKSEMDSLKTGFERDKADIADHEERIRKIEQSQMVQSTPGITKHVSAPTDANSRLDTHQPELTANVQGVSGGEVLSSNSAGFVQGDMVNNTTNIRVHCGNGHLALKMDIKDIKSKLSEHTERQKRDNTEMQSKIKTLEAKNEETVQTQKLKEVVSRLSQNMDSYKRDIGNLQTKIANHEEGIKTLEQSQDDRAQSLNNIQHQTWTDDEKISRQEVPSSPATVEEFHQAVRQGKLDKVKRLLSSGTVGVNCRGKKGRTPVMIAAWYRQGDMFDFLVQNHCDLSAVDDDNDNVFHFACLGGSKYIVMMLLGKNKFDIECRGQYGRTPLMRAEYNGHMSVVELLRKEGADFTTVDHKSNNILNVACLGGHVEMVQYVLSLNITHVECRGQHGRTPLMMAVELGHMSVVQLLNKAGADFTTVDDANNNILHVACLGGHVEMVQYVLSLNITHIECRGQYGRTPLMMAVAIGHMSVVELLKKVGADFTTVDDANNIILHVACLGGHIEMVQYVLSLNIYYIECRGKFGGTPLMKAVVKGHMSVVELLKKEGADFTAVDDHYLNILHVACLGGHLKMVKYLVTLEELRGFEGKKDKVGDTPLQVAQGKGHDDVVSFLQSRN